MAECNRCTLGFWRAAATGRLCDSGNKSLTQQVVSQLQAVGQVETGDGFEQTVCLNYQGQTMHLRRIELRLFQPTRDGEPEIGILTT